MKVYRFTVFFNHKVRKVFAGCKAEAIILTQAKQIKACLDYSVKAVKKEGEFV